MAGPNGVTVETGRCHLAHHAVQAVAVQQQGGASAVGCGYYVAQPMSPQGVQHVPQVHCPQPVYYVPQEALAQPMMVQMAVGAVQQQSAVPQQAGFQSQQQVLMDMMSPSLPTAAPTPGVIHAPPGSHVVQVSYGDACQPTYALAIPVQAPPAAPVLLTSVVHPMQPGQYGAQFRLHIQSEEGNEVIVAPGGSSLKDLQRIVREQSGRSGCVELVAKHPGGPVVISHPSHLLDVLSAASKGGRAVVDLDCRVGGPASVDTATATSATSATTVPRQYTEAEQHSHAIVRDWLRNLE